MLRTGEAEWEKERRGRWGLYAGNKQNIKSKTIGRRRWFKFPARSGTNRERERERVCVWEKIKVYLFSIFFGKTTSFYMIDSLS